MKLIAAIFAIALLAALAPATSSAANGSYTQVLCFNPDTGQGVGAPEEIRRLGGAPFPNLAVDCTGTVHTEGGITLQSGLPTTTTQRMAGEIEYKVPSGVDLVSGQVYRIVRVAGGGQKITLAQHAGPSLDFFALPRGELNQWWPDGLHDLGSSTAVWDTGNRLELAVAGGIWRYTGGCDASEGCSVAAGSMFVRIFGGKLQLRDTSDPQLVGEVSGSMTEFAAVSGSADATFSASDAGSGLYRTRVLVDDQQVSLRAVDTKGGRCVDANAQNADDYEFGSAAPCKLNAAVTASLDTNVAPDGPHRVKIQVEDASGNTTTVFNRALTFANHPVLAANGVAAATTSVNPTSPALAFFVSRKRLRNGQALRYFGSLTGAGHARRFVDVQVRKTKSRWQVVCSVQTDANGLYACRHRFKRTFRRTRYVFRARVRAQSGFSTQTLVTGRRVVVVRP